jgi:hypothetical protein
LCVAVWGVIFVGKIRANFLVQYGDSTHWCTSCWLMEQRPPA